MQDKKLTKREFLEKIRIAIKSSRMTQRDIAKALNLHPVALNMYLNGKRLPSDETMRRMSNFFNIDTNKQEINTINANINDEYWMERALKAEAKLEILIEQLNAIVNKNTATESRDGLYAAEGEE